MIRLPASLARPLLGLALLAGGTFPAGAMTYRLVTLDDGRCGRACPQVIAAEGAIELDEIERLAAFVRGLRSDVAPATILIHSPGGNVAGAIKLGYVIRRTGFSTVVGAVRQDRAGGFAPRTGTCASACVYVLMAGRARSVPQGSRVLVHGPRWAGVQQRDIVGGGSLDPRLPLGSITAFLEGYARQMGVDPDLVTLANAVPHETSLELTPAQIAGYRLATRAPGRPAARGRKPRQGA